MTNGGVSKSEDTWNKISISFDSKRSQPWRECLDFIENLKNTNVIMDMGCGNGRHLIPSAERSKFVIGFDLSRELLNIAKKKTAQKNLKNVDFIHGDAAHIPVKNNYFDAILYVAALHNIPSREKRIQSLREMKRIMKKQATALVTVWSRWQDKYRKEFIKKWFKRTKNLEFGDIEIDWKLEKQAIPRFYHLYGKKELEDDIKTAGLKIEKIMKLKLASKKYPDNYFAIVTKG
jgi:ubiquinone/menaquinone biosynthesis C-methylase UbiE